MRLFGTVQPAAVGALVLLTACLAESATRAGAASDSSAAEAHLARDRAVAATISEARAQRRVRELVALGSRMGGTRSGMLAAQYRTRVFEEAGLEVEPVLDPVKWCHEASTWRVTAEAESGREVVLESAWPYGFSPAGAVRGEAFLELSLEPRAGGAWLTERRPRGALDVEAGLPALVLVDGATTLDGAFPVVGHLDAGDDNPYPVFGLSREDGRRLRGELAGRVRIRYELETMLARSRPLTVVARLPARAGAPPGHLLFCAHGDSDSGGPGANDNASGEAIVLELAAAWSAAVDAGLLPAPAREVRFAIWGSELFSSRAYLERHAGTGELLGVLNFDQAGFGSGADQLNLEPDDLPANQGLLRTLLRVLREQNGAEGFPEQWATNKSLGGTDSYAFSDSELFRAGGRPALTVFTSAWGEPDEQPRTPGLLGESWRRRDAVRIDYDNYYHSSGDLPENTTDLEPWNMGWCARVALLGAHHWLETLP